MKRGIIALVLAFIGAACSSSSSSTSRSLGQGCTDSTECGGGLSCLPALVNNQCTTQKSCTKTCATDAECQASDAKAKCFAGCDNTKVCLLTP